MNKKLFNFIKISLGVIILLILFYKLGIKEITETLKIMNFWFLIPVYLLIFVSLALSTIGVYWLILPLKKEIRFAELFRYISVSWSTGMFFPGRFGELSLLYFLKKHKINYGEGAAIWIIDKIISLFVISVFSVIGFIIFFGKKNTIVLSVILCLIFGSIFLFMASNKIRSFVRKYILRKYEVHFKGFSVSFFSYFKNHKKQMALNLLATAIRFVLDGVMISLVFLSFKTIVPLLYLIIILSIESVISFIPITISGLGIRQSVSSYLYSIIGVALPIIGARQIIGILVQLTSGLVIIVSTKQRHIIKN